MSDKKVKKIGIDARLYGPVGKGLGRYTKEVTDRIAATDRSNQYVIFLNRENFGDFKINLPHVRKVLVDIRWYSWAEQLVLPFLIRRERLDLIHFPHFNVPLFCPVKFVVTIHDLILTKFPTHRASSLQPILYWLKNLAYRLTIWNALRRADKIIAVSDFTKKDIIGKYGVNAEKIIVTYEGIAQSIKSDPGRDDKKVLLSYNITKPFLLYVGNVYPHKNIERLIKVFHNISQKYPNWQLVLVGKNDYFYQRIKKYAESFSDLTGKVIFPGFVPDSDLSYFYRSAILYVFPSLYEGFGLPPLEAMSQGCVVASSNASSLPEILGDAALYFDPGNKDDIYEKIIRLATNDRLRSELKGKGGVWTKRYDWDLCAQATLDIYRQVLSL